MGRSVRILVATGIGLAIAACAPETGREGQEPSPAMPGGFEFAAANGDEPYREFTATALSFPAEQPELVDLSPAQLTDLIASGDIWLIDVRTPEEIADGMIAGADHIAIDTFKPSPAMLEQAAGREIVLYCRSGRRSAIAAADLSSFTGLPVKHLAGGIIAWEAAGGAVE